MKKLALVSTLLSAAALAQGVVPGGGTSSSGTAGSVTATSGSSATITSKAADGATAKGVILNNSITLANTSARLLEVRNGGTAKASLGIDGTLFSPGVTVFGATGFALTSNVADGASAVGLVVNNTTALANAAARLAEARNAGTAKWALGYDGTEYAPGVTTIGATSLTLKSTVADGASAVGHIMDTSISLANASAKLLSVRNAATEKSYFTKDGALVFLNASTGFDSITIPVNNDLCWGTQPCISGNGGNDLITTTAGAVWVNRLAFQKRALTSYTCGSSVEGSLVMDNTVGANTGTPSRVCMCRSDGAGAYAYVNILNGNLGTSTTCPN